jgi:hypothetical protein
MKRLTNSLFGPSRFNFFLNLVCIAIWALATIMLVWNIGPFPAPDHLAETPRLVLNTIGAALALIALPGALIIWVAMLVYWREGDKSPTWKKRLWLVLILVGFCFGASVYFWSTSKTIKESAV